ncbi:MAG TPA: fumarate hydratase [Chitinispirillaceae bacterium]|nr:fumarate hydratase [Chitinispirillaceae bacterium]
MRQIHCDTIIESVRQIALKAAFDLPPDVLRRLEAIHAEEDSAIGKRILNQILENADIAAKEKLPICQDTGTAVLFVQIGNDVAITGGVLPEALNEGVRRGYNEGYLRKSIVADPLFNRANTKDNTPASIHYDFVAGDKLAITILPKGGGCENMSNLAMLKPSDGKEGIIEFVVSSIVKAGGNPCPPVIVGIGIGGTADKACCLAKKALLRPVGSMHADKKYADFENELLSHINNSGVGPQGFGGHSTALAAHIETAPCHIASMPVALSLNCHAARNASVTI